MRAIEISILSTQLYYLCTNLRFLSPEDLNPFFITPENLLQDFEDSSDLLQENVKHQSADIAQAYRELSAEVQKLLQNNQLYIVSNIFIAQLNLPTRKLFYGGLEEGKEGVQIHLCNQKQCEFALGRSCQQRTTSKIKDGLLHFL